VGSNRVGHPWQICETNFEIHRQTAEGWEMRSVRDDLVEAVREAKRLLALPGTLAVRVVRDLYDPASNVSKPNTVYRAAIPFPEDLAEAYRKRRRARLAALVEEAETRRRRRISLGLALSPALVAVMAALFWLAR
jgi:hypothetical protein